MKAKNEEHTHRWRRLYEEFLLGGAFQVGYECIDCPEYVPNESLTPDGLPGTFLKKAMRLVGPHGGWGQTSEGMPYKEQIVDENGNLTIVRE